MKEKLKPNKAYSVSLVLLAAIIIFTIYLCGGIIFMIPFFFIFTFLVLNEIFKKISITETSLIYDSFFFKKKIKIKNIDKIYFVPHSGRGRDYYQVIYRKKNKIKNLKLISFKYDEIYEFIDSLKDLGIKIKKKPHKQKKLIYIFSGIYILIGIFIFYKSMYEFMNYVTEAIKGEYHVYNYYFLWLILAFIVVISISYIIYLFKKKYYNLIFYRTIIFIIVSIFIYFNMINIGTNNRNKMYNNLLKCKYQLTSYKLENERYPENITRFLQNNISFETNLYKGWDKTEIRIKKVASLDLSEIKPDMILMLKYVDSYHLFASFIKNDYLKIIDEKDRVKKISKRINLYHPSN